MLVTEDRDPVFYGEILNNNLTRQYDLMTDFIRIGIEQGPEAIDKYMVWALNMVAVSGLHQFGGRFREEPVYVGEHIPPHFGEVPKLMDRFISFIHENWADLSAIELAAYGLWRLNFIHPFIEGNGRTARAVCYYLLCVREKRLLPGRRIIPERIRGNRPPYYVALREADKQWEAGKLDVSALEDYLAGLLGSQLRGEES